MELQLHAPLLGVPCWGPNEMYALLSDSHEFICLGPFTTLEEMAQRTKVDKPVVFYIDCPGVQRLIKFVEEHKPSTPEMKCMFWYFRPQNKFLYWGEYPDYESALIEFNKRQFLPEHAMLFNPEAVENWRLQVMRTEPTVH